MFCDKYLLIKLGALGDVLLATALARALRAARPQARIALLTSPECVPLLEENPDLDEVLCVEMNARGRPLHPAQLLRSMAAWSEGTAVILHRHWSLSLLCRLAGFRRIAGYAQGWNPCLTHAAEFNLHQHRMVRQEAVLRLLGVDGDARQMRLVLRSSERAFGDSVWRRMPARGLRLVLAPGGGRNRWSSMPNRRWPPASFAEIAARAVQAGFAVQIVGALSDLPVARQVAGERAEVATEGVGTWTTRETAAVIAAADLLVSNDSLPMFLAAALQTPLIGLYGPTDSRVIHPPGAGPALQGAVRCGPCFSPFDGVDGLAYRCSRALCMEAITPDRVWREITRAAPEPLW